MRFVRDNPAIETVMLVSIWRQPYEAGLLYKGGWTVDEQAEKYFADQLEADVRTFRDAGKVVILVEPFFASPADVSRTMAGNLAYGRNWPIDTPLARHRAEFGKLYAAFTQAAGAGALRISLVEDFCPQELCRGNLDGRPVFTDNNHLAHSHSSRVSFIFEREIGALERKHQGPERCLHDHALAPCLSQRHNRTVFQTIEFLPVVALRQGPRRRESGAKGFRPLWLEIVG